MVPRGGTLASLLEKKEQRLRFMHRLYEVTDGSPLVDVESTRIGEEFGWSEQETDRVVEYLMGEGLVEYFAGGNMINVTHAGVVEVEAVLDNPDRGTEHFPPAGNVIVIGQMHSSQIQQGTEGSQQLATFNEPNRDQLLAVVESYWRSCPTSRWIRRIVRKQKRNLARPRFSSAPTARSGPSSGLAWEG
jgi:hypothetical protein